MKESLFHPILIKDTTIPGNLFLAPLAGFTDPAFREICLLHGASFTYSEMVSAEALARNSGKTFTLMKRGDGEDLFGIQIFLSDSDTAKRALSAVLKANPAIIDINCGCPVPKVVKTGSGAALMKNPAEIGRIVQAISRNTDIPVTVKIRSGWDINSITFLKAAEAAVQGGAALITMHPRTRSQGYSGDAHWEHLRELKSTVSVPVIGSGNLFLPEDAKSMMEETGVDGIMFARGAIGNPFIFNQTRELLQNGTYTPAPSVKVKFDTALLHLKKCIVYKGERTACKEMRKHISSYTKGIPNAAALRHRIVQASTYDEYKEIFEEFSEITLKRSI